MSYLSEVARLADEYTEIELYQAVFEAEQIEPIQQKNEKIERDSQNLFQKAIAAIKAILKKTKDLIANCISWFTSSDEDKDKFKKFRDECAANPEFANMKISITNWKQIEASYQKAINAAESEYKAIKDGETVDRQGKLNGIMESLKKTATAATTSVTVEAALRMAKDSVDNAAVIQTALDLDFGLINKLESEIGKKETKKFKNKIKALNSRFAFRRWIAGARESQGKKLKDCLSEIYKNVDGAYLKVNHRARGNKTYKTAQDAIVGGALQGVSQNKRAIGSMIRKGKEHIKNGDEFDIKVDRLMSQFKGDKFTRENLKNMSDSDLQDAYRQARDTQKTLGSIIQTNKKAAKRFGASGTLEWNKTLKCKSKLDTLTDNIEDLLDKRRKKRR